MASILSIQNAISYARPLIKQQDVFINNLEPAITAANDVLGRMLGPPMIWRSNRGNFSIPITPSATDYAIALNTLGRIETQWLQDSAQNVFELTGMQTLAVPTSSNQARPTIVAPVYDNNAGQVTFRFNAWPDKDYTAFFDYQLKAPLLAAPGSSFAPVPDEFGYIFNKGFLAEVMFLVNDARWPIVANEFASALLGAQDGLSEQAKAIFLGDWMAAMATITRATGAAQSGVAARQK
jgi:hypothetical protein